MHIIVIIFTHTQRSIKELTSIDRKLRDLRAGFLGRG